MIQHTHTIDDYAIRANDGDGQFDRDQMQIKLDASILNAQRFHPSKTRTSDTQNPQKRATPRNRHPMCMQNQQIENRISFT